MTVDEAIKTALQFERRVCGAYEDATERAKNPTAQRVFRVLAGEERHHVEYLEEKLEEWEKTGKLTVEGLETTIPSAEAISKAVSQVKEQITEEPDPGELELLREALVAEQQTSNFYRRVVGQLGGSEQALFVRFLEIEEGHEAIVQAEIDLVTNSGFWFDMREFDLERMG